MNIKRAAQLLRTTLTPEALSVQPNPEFQDTWLSVLEQAERTGELKFCDCRGCQVPWSSENPDQPLERVVLEFASALEGPLLAQWESFEQMREDFLAQKGWTWEEEHAA